MIQTKQLLGILYLENNLATGAFTSDRVELLNLLCTQAAISLENARLYERDISVGEAVVDIASPSRKSFTAEKRKLLNS